jgi:Ni,Fe-hydrogenase I cytochrome b subunit
MIAGPLSDAYGIRVWFWIAGILCMLIAITGFFIPVVMNVESSHNENQPEPVSIRVVKNE